MEDAQFEADLAAALAASAAEHQQQHCTLELDSSFHAARSTIVRGDGARVEGLEAEPRCGELNQLNLFDQFHPTFNGLVEEHCAPSAICGYVSCALAKQLAVRLAAGEASGEERVLTAEALAVAEALRDGEALKPELRAAMAHVRAHRERWIGTHPSDFPDERSRHEYLSAWVANYEISDYLASLPAVDGVVFLRFNQWPERGNARHEEAVRLVAEEARFGGQAQGDKADTARCAGGADEESDYSMFIVEDFGADAAAGGVPGAGGGPVLRTPAEWLCARAASGRPHRPRVFVLDLNGHFCVAVPHSTPRKVPGGEECCLTLLNTTQASYLGGAGGLIASVAFDLAFPPLPSAA